jgi:hypothetical protein
MMQLSYAGYGFPPEIIQYAIWLYLRFTMSFRDGEELLAERGIDVSHETIRRWVAVFGPMIARRLRADFFNVLTGSALYPESPALLVSLGRGRRNEHHFRFRSSRQMASFYETRVLQYLPGSDDAALSMPHALKIILD